MNIALILAGGTGSRLGGDTPKQYLEVGGRPIIAYCMETFFRHKEVDAVHIVADACRRGLISEYVCMDKFRGFSDVGETRQLSIVSGLTDIITYAADSDYVIIHDAARPLVSAKDISACLSAAQGHDGALPVLAMKDTVYLSDNGKTVARLIDRSRLFAGQAPEAFVLGKYLAANRALLPDRIKQINGSTEPAILAGMDIALTPGNENNFKITTRADLERFAATIRQVHK
ncbi:MAG: IspD/TarI family cytidylyltransferase [Oscillospiraceae bacterium]